MTATTDAKSTAERAVEMFQRATGNVLKADHRALLIDVVAGEIERDQIDAAKSTITVPEQS